MALGPRLEGFKSETAALQLKLGVLCIDYAEALTFGHRRRFFVARGDFCRDEWTISEAIRRSCERQLEAMSLKVRFLSGEEVEIVHEEDATVGWLKKHLEVMYETHCIILGIIRWAFFRCSEYIWRYKALI